jgi:hypothetical protein
MFFMIVIAGCGKTPPDKPLLEGTGTPTQQIGASTTSTSLHGAPIVVLANQSHLSTYPGGNMSLSITTSPYTVCQFLLYYGQSSPSKDLGIIPRTTDAQGNASWNWQVNLKVHTGTWPLKIIATASNGAVSTTTVNVTITLPPISLVSSQSNLIGYPKGNLLLTIATAPWINCDLVLNYGPGGVTKTLRASANDKGIAAWNWRIDRTALTGVWSLPITVTLPDGESTSSQVNVTIL